MRETKFRAWDIDQMRMLPPSSIWKCDFRKYNTGDYSLMQYTGLKDKNGKEIYEGDIVIVQDEFDNFASEYDEVNDEYVNTEKMLIKWGNEYPAFDVFNLDGSYHDCEYNVLTIATIEVIGNIYENPELTESK